MGKYCDMAIVYTNQARCETTSPATRRGAPEKDCCLISPAPMRCHSASRVRAPTLASCSQRRAFFFFFFLCISTSPPQDTSSAGEQTALSRGMFVFFFLC